MDTSTLDAKVSTDERATAKEKRINKVTKKLWILLNSDMPISVATADQRIDATSDPYEILEGFKRLGINKGGIYELDCGGSTNPYDRVFQKIA